MRPIRIGNTSFSIHLSIVHRETGATMAEGAMDFVFVTGDLDADEPPRPTPVPRGLRDALAAAGCTF